MTGVRTYADLPTTLAPDGMPGRSRRAEQRRESSSRSHCHSPNFCIAGSDDIRALAESAQRKICMSEPYVAARDTICHVQVAR
jgi:hypothetical protein